MATLLVVENGWSSKRLYFADTEDGLVKAKQAIKDQKNLLKIPNRHDEVYLSRLRAERDEEPVMYSSSDDDDEEPLKSEKPTPEQSARRAHDAIDRRLVGKIQIVRPVLKVDDDEHKRASSS